MKSPGGDSEIMLVRPFQLSDYAAVEQIMVNSLSEECLEETKEAFARQLAWDSSLILVAENKGSLAGFVIGTIDQNNGYYYRLAVDPSHRRQGIGKALIRSLKARFEERKVRRILVPVDPHNEPILPVFQALGFDMDSFTRSFQNLSIVSGT